MDKDKINQEYLSLSLNTYLVYLYLVVQGFPDVGFPYLAKPYPDFPDMVNPYLVKPYQARIYEGFRR